MNKLFFGFALADSMFAQDCVIRRTSVTIEQVREYLPNAIPCLNPSHTATIDAMRSRFAIDIAIPERPPQVALNSGDSLIVMGVRGLPRLTDRHEYTQDEIEAATFSFTRYDMHAGEKTTIILVDDAVLL